MQRPLGLFQPINVYLHPRPVLAFLVQVVRQDVDLLAHVLLELVKLVFQFLVGFFPCVVHYGRSRLDGGRGRL